MEVVTNGQKFALIKLCSKFTKYRHERLWLLSKLLGRKIDTTSDVLLIEWQTIRDSAYPDWPNHNWELSEEFTTKCFRLVREYEKEVVGQGELFQ